VRPLTPFSPPIRPLSAPGHRIFSMLADSFPRSPRPPRFFLPTCPSLVHSTDFAKGLSILPGLAISSYPSSPQPINPFLSSHGAPSCAEFCALFPFRDRFPSTGSRRPLRLVPSPTSLARSRRDKMITFSPQETPKFTPTHSKKSSQRTVRPLRFRPNRAFLASEEFQPISLCPNELSPVFRLQKGPERPGFSPLLVFLRIAVLQSQITVTRLLLALFAPSREKKHPGKAASPCGPHAGFATAQSVCYPWLLQERPRVPGACSEKMTEFGESCPSCDGVREEYVVVPRASCP
jgi:hypothetical protein